MSIKSLERPFCLSRMAMGLICDEGWSNVAEDPSQKKTFWACWLNIYKERGFAPFRSSMVPPPFSKWTDYWHLKVGSPEDKASPDRDFFLPPPSPCVSETHFASACVSRWVPTGKRSPCKGTLPRSPQSQTRPASHMRTWEWYADLITTQNSWKMHL